ncbi:hypothetical protein B0H15DRAFT_215549 [Mycena belliarum]|uniref:N-acetyltransferase domain-containing protein n=1 Tax=Mycena belliarum TaxID=1033014 RepID=A0AAD6UKR9_9AGAR|nr:hypothetical protein B0H15DRAFT_215549 [Mycena belliae]
MAEALPTATIRPLQKEDEKLAHFMVAKASMESLAAANRRAYYHPLVLSIWIGLSCVFIEYMQWWPNPRVGFVTFLSPLPAFASVLVPVMFFIDWINRPYFEKLTQDVLRAPGMKHIQDYYSRSPASGFWIMEYGDRFVGLVAIDASVQDASNGNRKAATSQTATLRHFYVQEPYPAAGVQDDLLSHALDHCLNAKPAIVQEVNAQDSPLVPYARKSMKEAGFTLAKETGRVGLFRWRLGMCTLRRDVWEQARKAVTD